MAIRAEVQRAVSHSGVPSTEQFRRWAGAVDHQRESSACIRVVDETEMGTLNERYRGELGVTNVLAFAADWRERDLGFLGDIAICAPEVFREACRFGQESEARFAHMTIHGLLHLLGHDHGEARAAASMESVERAVMERLGYPDPYELE